MTRFRLTRWLLFYLAMLLADAGGGVTPIDSLKLLRYDARLIVSQDDG